MRKANFGSPENGTLIASHGFAIEDNRFKDVRWLAWARF
jgi:hypothetical protein